MEYFSEPQIQSFRQRLLAMSASVAAHLLLGLIIIFLPFFVTRSSVPMQFVDVTLLDTIYPGDLGDIEPAKPEAQAENKSVEPPKKEPIEPPKPKPTKELVDPSDAELERMKKRKETQTLPPQKPSSVDFPIKSSILPDGAGRTSGSMQVDVKDFPFYYYLSMLKNRVSENWIPPYGAFEAEARRVVIAFRIDRQGSQYDARIEESSGNDLLDQSALRAVKVSSPFPPLPEGFTGTDLGVYFGFSVQL
ncbi:MAG: energy transducer TonB [bacterium]